MGEKADSQTFFRKTKDFVFGALADFKREKKEERERESESKRKQYRIRLRKGGRISSRVDFFSG